MSKIIPVVGIEQKIFLIRKQKVMLDRDLAHLFGVPTKVLNQAVKRNTTRFPSDFMFSLTPSEMRELVTNCDRLEMLKHSSAPLRVFTEHGVLMAANVLNSKRAITVSIWIIRTFIKMRAVVLEHGELIVRLKELERTVGLHDEKIRVIFEAIRKLMAPPPEKPKRPIGFIVDRQGE